MKKLYGCVHVSKEVEVDDFDEGCRGERTSLLDEKCNITADTLPDLIHAIGNTYGFRIDDIYLPWADDGREIVDWMTYSRLENVEGCDPSETEKERWKGGDLTLYCADYMFQIEKRLVSPIRAEEFKQAGIRCVS